LRSADRPCINSSGTSNSSRYASAEACASQSPSSNSSSPTASRRANDESTPSGGEPCSTSTGLHYDGAMGNDARTVLNESLALAEHDRADLAAELLASLNEPTADSQEEIDRLWAVEIERRSNRANSGESRSEPWDEVRSRIERNLASGWDTRLSSIPKHRSNWSRLRSGTRVNDQNSAPTSFAPPAARSSAWRSGGSSDCEFQHSTDRSTSWVASNCEDLDIRPVVRRYDDWCWSCRRDVDQPQAPSVGCGLRPAAGRLGHRRRRRGTADSGTCHPSRRQQGVCTTRVEPRCHRLRVSSRRPPLRIRWSSLHLDPWTSNRLSPTWGHRLTMTSPWRRTVNRSTRRKGLSPTWTRSTNRASGLSRPDAVSVEERDPPLADRDAEVVVVSKSPTVTDIATKILQLLLLW